MKFVWSKRIGLYCWSSEGCRGGLSSIALGGVGWRKFSPRGTCKGSGRNLYFRHSFTFRTLHFVLCTLYFLLCTAASYPCTPSLLKSIYRRKDGGDQGTLLYLCTLHSSYYKVIRPYLRILLQNRVTFISNNLRQFYGKRRGSGSYKVDFGSRGLVTLSTIDTTHIRYHHQRRTIAASTDIKQRPHSSTTKYTEQRHLDSANNDSSLLDDRLSTLDLVLFVPNSLHRSWFAYCSQFAATTLGLVHKLSWTWPNFLY